MTNLIKPSAVKGYKNLSLENRKLIEDFLEKYYRVYEYPEEHQPVSVKKGEGYLRVNFKNYWLHVIDKNTWY